MFDLGRTSLAAVERNPNATAITDGGRRLSYVSWYEEIGRIAGGLTALGRGGGDRLALLMREIAFREYAGRSTTAAISDLRAIGLGEFMEASLFSRRNGTDRRGPFVSPFSLQDISCGLPDDSLRSVLERY